MARLPGIVAPDLHLHNIQDIDYSHDVCGCGLMTSGCTVKAKKVKSQRTLCTPVHTGTA